MFHEPQIKTNVWLFFTNLHCQIVVGIYSFCLDKYSGIVMNVYVADSFLYFPLTIFCGVKCDDELRHNLINVTV